MQNSLAPIGLSTYGRLEHVQLTVEALQKNELAKESELYIFSDAAKAGDEEKVETVRQYLRTIDGFRGVYLFERERNDRIANNRGGMRMLLEKHGRLIFLEEDIVTAPSFLSFMNEALEKYKNDPRVFAVNGYTPPISIPEGYQSSVILLPRFAAWGFGIWEEKFDEIIMDITPEMYSDIRCDRENLKEYSQGGNDIITQLWLQSHRYIDALDVKIDYTMFVKGRQHVVCPTRSLAQTTGCDGSGEHWVQQTEKYNVQLDVSGESIAVEKGIQPDAHILSSLRDFYALSIKGRLIHWAMDFGLYGSYRELKRQFKK